MGKVAAVALVIVLGGVARADEQDCQESAVDDIGFGAGECVAKPKKEPNPPAPDRPADSPSAGATERPEEPMVPALVVEEIARRADQNGPAAIQSLDQMGAMIYAEMQKQSDERARAVYEAAARKVLAAMKAVEARPARPLQLPQTSEAFRQLVRANDLSVQARDAANVGNLETAHDLARAAFEGNPQTGSVGEQPVIGTNFFGASSSAASPVPVGGVRMAFDPRALAAALSAAAAHPGFVEKLESRMLTLRESHNPTASILLMEAAARREALSGRALVEERGLVVVSLRNLVTAAEAYRGRWSELPEPLRHPGGLRRLRGFLVDRAADDLLLLGTVEGPGDPIDIDDLTVGLRAVWKEGQTPFCSLDPDPEDPAGPQRARIGGVPKDSPFAKTMLDADYAMKRVMNEVERVDVPGYRTLLKIVQREHPSEFRTRFWFYPVQPTPGDVQVSADGGTLLFTSDVQVLSEEVAFARQGMIGMGRTVTVADEAGASFTEHRRDIAQKQPVVARLMALFDVVLLGRILKSVGTQTALLERVVALPYRPVVVPESYPGVRVAIDATQSMILFGGVEIRVDASPRTWFALAARKSSDLRRRTDGVARSGRVSATLRDARIELPAPVPHRNEAQERSENDALARLAAHDLGGALEAAARAVRADPGDAGARLTLAEVRLVRGEVTSARREVLAARALAPENRWQAEAVGRILLACDLFDGRRDAALVELDRLVAGEPSSAELQIQRGHLLQQMGRAPEARAALRRAIEIDPSSAPAYAELSMIEGAQGWPLKAKSLARKAYALGATRLDTRIALATAEMRLANLAAARGLAESELKDAATDPVSRTQLLVPLVTAAAALDRSPDAVDRWVRRGDDLPPGLRDAILELGAQLVAELGRPDLAQQYRSLIRGELR